MHHTCIKLILRYTYRIIYGQYAVKVRRHTPWSRVSCHGCRFTHRQFHSPFHSRRYSLRITLKCTTLVHMRSGYAWTMNPWQWSVWRLGFNSVLWQVRLVEGSGYVLYEIFPKLVNHFYWFRKLINNCERRNPYMIEIFESILIVGVILWYTVILWVFFKLTIHWSIILRNSLQQQKIIYFSC